MRSFRDAYQDAVKKLPEFSMDAGLVSDEIHHRKMTDARRRKEGLAFLSAACVFLLCGVGTAFAVGYHAARMETGRDSFDLIAGGAQGALEEEAEETTPKMARLYSCNPVAVCPEEEESAAVKGTEEIAAVKGTEEDAAVKGTEEDAAVKGTEEDAAAEGTEEIAAAKEMQERKTETVTYHSVSEFQRKEEIAAAIPPLSLLGDSQSMVYQEVTVNRQAGLVLVKVDFQDKSFVMRQQDYGGTEAPSRGAGRPAGAAQERLVKNGQGFSWKVSAPGEEEELPGICATVSVAQRDLVFYFSHYKEEEIDAILKQADFRIYFKEEE